MSLKGDKYETLEEVQFRLLNTVVMYDGKPVYITNIRMPDQGDPKQDVARVYFTELPFNKGLDRIKEERKFLSSRKFDLSPFRMGYMNYKDRAIFVSRAPVRQNKQGLNGNCTSYTTPLGRRDDDISFNMMIGSQGFADMVNGVYPTFNEAGERLADPATKSVAISRSFAVLIDHDLEALLLVNKGVRCGIAMKGDRGFKMGPKYHFLQQELEEYRIPVL